MVALPSTWPSCRPPWCESYSIVLDTRQKTATIEATVVRYRGYSTFRPKREHRVMRIPQTVFHIETRDLIVLADSDDQRNLYFMWYAILRLGMVMTWAMQNDLFKFHHEASDSMRTAIDEWMKRYGWMMYTDTLTIEMTEAGQ